MSSSHAARRVGFAAFLIVIGSIGLRYADAFGDTRTISLHHVHTGEDLTITYMKNGRYIPAAMKKIDWIMRDWRKNRATEMDPHEIDLLWEVYQEVGATAPIYIICGYRSPATNEMLRRRSRHSGVARYSQHILGKAIDFYIPGVPLAKLRATAMKLQGGGVGYYPVSGSPFVHLDIGRVRAWPRMTRTQLAKLFPDGRTVHLPSDGKPLPGYQLALADIERRGHYVVPPAAATPKKRSLLAALFGSGRHDETDDEKAPAGPNTSTTPTPTVVASAAEPVTANVPMPPTRPMYQIASAQSRPARWPEPPTTVAALTPNDIVGRRGAWESFAQAAPQAAAEAPADSLSSARRILASSLVAAAGRDTTATVGPFARPDRVPPEIALAYAAEADAGNRRLDAAMASRIGGGPPTVVTRKGSTSVAIKPAETMPHSHLAKTAERLNDPWLRSLMLTASVQHTMTVTRFGDPEFERLTSYIHKPKSAVVMTFSRDPHLGMVADAFTGGAVVFQATVTFVDQRTAALQ